MGRDWLHIVCPKDGRIRLRRNTITSGTIGTVFGGGAPPLSRFARGRCRRPAVAGASTPPVNRGKTVPGHLPPDNLNRRG